MDRRTVIGHAVLVVAVGLPAVAAGPEDTSRVEVARLAAPPHIDGRLDEAEWNGAARLELRYQVQPGDNAAPSEVTEVRLGYDAVNLYVGVRAADRNAASVRAHVARRDDIFGDDYVTLYLDTYDDRRRAYVFSFNPFGVQADWIYTEGQAIGRDFDENVDRKWDGVFVSKGTLDAAGYTVEAAIPFATLRFPATAEQRWGLHVQRWIARRGESVHWRPLSRDQAGLLPQMGALSGLRGLQGRRTFDLIPTATASLTQARQPGGALNGTTRGDPGITGTWAVTSGITLAGAVNPDFSQIEADVPQIEVNQRFPLFYPEKRPFFLEGDQFFRSPGALTFLYTRQIVDPDWGAKVTGKAGRNTFALLSAADRSAGLRPSPGRPGFGDDALFTVARYQRDVRSSSTVGAFLTDRRFAGGRNTVAATDGQLRLPRSSIVGFQLARSWTDGDGRGPREGSATYLWYELQGRHWRLFANDLRLSDDYAAEAGFVRRTGIRANLVNFGYELQPSRPSWYVKLRPFVVARYLRTSQGLTDESFVDPGFDLTLPRDVTFYVYHSFHRDAYLGREYDYQFNVAIYTVKALKKVTLDGRLQFGEGVHFDPARPQVGRALESSLTVTLRPDDRVSAELLYLKSRLREKTGGRALFDQDLLRGKVTYQHTAAYGARAIVEYDDRRRRWDLSGLLSFVPRANTAVYLGYGDVLFDDRDPLDGRHWPGTHRLRRTFFLKVSYGYRR